MNLRFEDGEVTDASDAHGGDAAEHVLKRRQVCQVILHKRRVRIKCHEVKGIKKGFKNVAHQHREY